MSIEIKSENFSPRLKQGAFDQWIHQKESEHIKLVKKAVANSIIDIHFEDFKKDIFICQWDDPKSKLLNLLELFRNNKICVASMPGYYDYSKKIESAHNVFVDFAARELGGGTLGTGFLQEEQMFFKFLQLVALICDRANTYFTRKDGNPNPIFIGNVKEFMKTDVYGGSSFKGIKPDEIQHRFKVVDAGTAVSANILALSAQNVNKSGIDPLSLDVITDLFKMVHSGFMLAQECNRCLDQATAIHTGRIGCGDFGNDYALVYCIQRLAAMHLKESVKVHFYAHYTDSNECVTNAPLKVKAKELQTAKEAEILWKKLEVQIKDEMSVNDVLTKLYELRQEMKNDEMESSNNSNIHTIPETEKKKEDEKKPEEPKGWFSAIKTWFWSAIEWVFNLFSFSSTQH
jgi:hypothetical protein